MCVYVCMCRCVCVCVCVSVGIRMMSPVQIFNRWTAFLPTRVNYNNANLSLISFAKFHFNPNFTDDRFVCFVNLIKTKPLSHALQVPIYVREQDIDKRSELKQLGLVHIIICETNRSGSLVFFHMLGHWETLFNVSLCF